MTSWSDNTATDLIVIGGKDNVNATMRRLGLNRTVIAADCRDILFDLVGPMTSRRRRRRSRYLQLAKAANKGSGASER
jgi:beta-lactamase class A